MTSSGNNDSGMSETNLRDERFLPFEGAGAVSTWRLELPADFRQFDYNTISNVVLHVRFTARQGGDLLKQAATENIETQVSDVNAAGFALLLPISLRENTLKLPSEKCWRYMTTMCSRSRWPHPMN